MSKRDWKLFVEDILECVQKIEKYVQDMELEDFKESDITIDAVLRNLEIIGEAARNIDINIRKQYNDIPWQDIVDFRNRITHGYFTISLPIIWQIIKQELPPLKEKLNRILEESEQ